MVKATTPKPAKKRAGFYAKNEPPAPGPRRQLSGGEIERNLKAWRDQSAKGALADHLDQIEALAFRILGRHGIAAPDEAAQRFPADSEVGFALMVVDRIEDGRRTVADEGQAYAFIRGYRLAEAYFRWHEEWELGPEISSGLKSTAGNDERTQRSRESRERGKREREARYLEMNAELAPTLSKINRGHIIHKRLRGDPDQRDPKTISRCLPDQTK